MGIVGQFLRDAIAGGDFGACCTTNVSGPGFNCTMRNKQSCFNVQEVNPDPQNIFFYPGLSCSEVECGTAACCTDDGCENTDWYNPGGSHFPSPCDVLDGEQKPRGTQCGQGLCDVPEPPEERPEGCMSEPVIRETRKTPGGYTWNTDLCQNAQFRMTIRRLDEWPVDAATRNVTSVNYAEMQSVGPIRANETAPGVEPCRRHFAKIGITNDGYARMFMCGQHVSTDSDTLQVSEGRFYLENNSIRPKVAGLQTIDNGYGAAAVGYRAPFWVEAIYHSQQIYCGGRL